MALHEIYNIKYKCNYREDNMHDPEDNCRYQTDFLAIFRQSVYDDDAVNSVIETIYTTFLGCPEFIGILERMKHKLARPNYDNLIALMFCYSYDYLHVMHPFVAYLIQHPTADMTDLVYKDLYLAMLEAVAH